jgi:hypothetical protein
MTESLFALDYVAIMARVYWRANHSARRVGGLTFLRFGRFGLSYYVTRKPIR